MHWQSLCHSDNRIIKDPGLEELERIYYGHAGQKSIFGWILNDPTPEDFLRHNYYVGKSTLLFKANFVGELLSKHPTLVYSSTNSFGVINQYGNMWSYIP